MIPRKFSLILSCAIILNSLHLLPSYAEEIPKKRLVIIDTGIDTTIEEFRGHLVYEVCVMTWYSCPNGRDFQEGEGSAKISGALLAINGFDHGTQMAGIALRFNPQLEFIFMRIVGNNNQGSRLNTSEIAVSKALEWIETNASKFNIGAVSMSLGQHDFKTATKYCPSVPAVDARIYALKNLNIPVFLPTGNNGDKSRIDWPACIISAIAVGSIDSKDKITGYSNMDRLLSDFYALGDFQIVGAAGVERFASGTSVSTQVAAAQWLSVAAQFPDKTFKELYNAFRTSGTIIYDRSFRFGRKFDPIKASDLLAQLIKP